MRTRLAVTAALGAALIGVLVPSPAFAAPHGKPGGSLSAGVSTGADVSWRSAGGRCRRARPSAS